MIWHFVLGAVVGVMVLASCRQRGSNATLEERANKYWELKQTKRWEEVYDGYLDPALKKSITRDAFLKTRVLAFDVLSYTITEATENGDEGMVHAEAEANIPLRGIGGAVQMRRKTITVEDPWVRREGMWYIRLPE